MKMGLAEPSSRNPDGSRRPPEGENVGVFARLRPEAAGTKKGELTVKSRFGEQRTCTVRNLEFSLDWVFDEDAAQEDVYEVAARERVAGVLDGYNATLLAYGQTGSGKTHTMYGPPEVLASFEGAAYDDYGLVPRACEQIFEAIDAADVEAGYIVQCSYLEVYNDRINDLLAGRKNLAVRERSRGVVVDGLHFEAVDGLASTMAVLQAGDANRVVAAMKMNPRSSRGHALFALHVSDTRPDAEAEGGARRAIRRNSFRRNSLTRLFSRAAGKLTLVDLAGMESAKKSYAAEGPSNQPARREEAKNINTSLYALGTVIERLASGDVGHVPWRNSKLTRLLQDSLGGNSRSAIVTTLRAEEKNIDETIGTLRFAQRAKAIAVKVTQNEV